MQAKLTQWSLRQHLDGAALRACSRFELFDTLASTNTYLKQFSPESSGVCQVVLAEAQTGGRGRRGNTWFSPPQASLYMSLRTRLAHDESVLGLLPLGIGAVVAESLQTLGLTGHGLKWPNDLLKAGRKFGGILVESDRVRSHDMAVTIGIGLNVDFHGITPGEVTQPWTDLASIMIGGVPDRAELAGQILNGLLALLTALAESRDAAILPRWRHYDLTCGQPVAITAGDGTCHGGRAMGIDRRGRLIVDTDQGIRSFDGGEVSLRLPL